MDVLPTVWSSIGTPHAALTPNASASKLTPLARSISTVVDAAAAGAARVRARIAVAAARSSRLERMAWLLSPGWLAVRWLERWRVLTRRCGLRGEALPGPVRHPPVRERDSRRSGRMVQRDPEQRLAIDGPPEERGRVGRPQRAALGQP